MTNQHITINTENLRGEIAPLYCRCQGQTNAQPAYVELGEDGYVSADYSGEIGNGVPFTVWHRRTLRWAVPSQSSGNALADLIESADIVALLERVSAGHTVEWDGSNFVGSLDDDARAASDELESIFGRPEDEGCVWDASEWMVGAGLHSWWIGVPLDTAVADTESAAESEGVYLDGDVEDVLLDMAERYIANDKPGLDAWHLSALVAAERITADDAAEYADGHPGGA